MENKKPTKEYKLLKALAFYKGLTLKELAEKVGISYENLKNLNTNNRDLPFYLVEKLAELYNTTADNIVRMRRENKMDPALMNKVNIEQNKDKISKDAYYIINNYNNIKDKDKKLIVYKLLDLLNKWQNIKEKETESLAEFEAFNLEKEKEFLALLIVSLIEEIKKLDILK